MRVRYAQILPLENGLGGLIVSLLRNVQKLSHALASRGTRMNRHFPMYLKLIDPDIYDHSALDDFPVKESAMELSDSNAMFLAGLLRRYRPKTLLEVGVSAGGSSALLLHILDKLGIESEVVSVDLSEKWFRDEAFATGWAAKKLYPDKKNWNLHTGRFLPEIIEDLNMEFDFCFLDTVHSLPGEILDYLVVLPFMHEDAVIAMHDTSLYFYGKSSDMLATRVLITACVGEKILPPQLSEADANLCAVQITAETYKNIGNIFSALYLPWPYLLDGRQFKIYREFFLRYYGPEAAEIFSRAMEWNTAYLIKNFRKALDNRRNS